MRLLSLPRKRPCLDPRVRKVPLAVPAEQTGASRNPVSPEDRVRCAMLQWTAQRAGKSMHALTRAHSKPAGGPSSAKCESTLGKHDLQTSYRSRRGKRLAVPSSESPIGSLKGRHGNTQHLVYLPPTEQIHDGLLSDRLERCEHLRVVKTRYRLETGIRSKEQPYPSDGVRGHVDGFRAGEQFQLPLQLSSVTSL